MNVEIRYAQIKDASGNRQRIYFLAVPSAGGRMRSLNLAEYGQLLQLTIKGWRKSYFRRLWAFLFNRKAVAK